MQCKSNTDLVVIIVNVISVRSITRENEYLDLANKTPSTLHEYPDIIMAQWFSSKQLDQILFFIKEINCPLKGVPFL